MNYYVLFVQTQNQDVLVSLLRKEGMEAFSFKYEYYRRDIDGISLKALFPGYVFVRSNKNQVDFFTAIRKMEVKKGFIKELRYKDVPALTKEEIVVLERLLDKQGILRMSYGHLENKRLTIDSGPLMGFEDYIVKVDRHNHMVWLNLYFLDHQQWVSGVMVRHETN
ncbi:transcription termination/antitermination NusG family protein [Floccifex sp.]|uniref:transcription termination/antitermination NusG family protein n=1 Tax=Floccifex sp. TaxID=2815810 RepID=UPI003EF18CC6